MTELREKTCGRLLKHLRVDIHQRHDLQSLGDEVGLCLIFMQAIEYGIVDGDVVPLPVRAAIAEKLATDQWPYEDVLAMVNGACGASVSTPLLQRVPPIPESAAPIILLPQRPRMSWRQPVQWASAALAATILVVFFRRFKHA
jgi:hypothetical protein